MNLNDFEPCEHCYNRPSHVLKCEMCHYSGFVTLDGRPSTSVFGETPKWKRKIRKEQEKQERLAEKRGRKQLRIA